MRHTGHTRLSIVELLTVLTPSPAKQPHILARYAAACLLLDTWLLKQKASGRRSHLLAALVDYMQQHNHDHLGAPRAQPSQLVTLTVLSLARIGHTLAGCCCEAACSIADLQDKLHPAAGSASAVSGADSHTASARAKHTYLSRVSGSRRQST